MTGRVLVVTLEDQGVDRPASDLGRCAHATIREARPRFDPGTLARTRPFRRRCPNGATTAHDGRPLCRQHACRPSGGPKES